MRRLVVVIALTSSAFFAGSASAVNIFVDAAATGSNNGSEWAHAYTDLQDALADADPNTNDVIFVKYGTYKPGTLRTDTFALKRNVKVYGHCAGTETSPGQRQLNNPAYTTILSGDLNGDDTANFGNRGDNSHHVVSAIGTFPTNLLEGAQFDGFTIRGGYTDGASVTSGAGIYMDRAKPIISRCIIEDNWAVADGGGIGCARTQFLNPYIANCIIRNNKADNRGGGIFLDDLVDAGSGSPIIVNCLIDSNTAAFGGGLYSEDSGSPQVINSTVVRNVGGGLMHENLDDPATTSHVLNVTNTISYLNTISSATTFAAQVDGSANIQYSCIQNYPGSGSLPAYMSADAQTIDDAPEFINAGGMSLTPLDPTGESTLTHVDPAP